jgi:hypothetical protein
VSIVLKSGSLKLLESSGPVQACNGIAVQAFRVCDYAETELKHPFRLLFSEFYCTSEYKDVPGYFGDIIKHPPEIRNVNIVSSHENHDQTS